MAITAPTQRYAANNAAQTSTTAFSPTSNTTAGALLVIGAGAGAGSKVISSISDTKSNTWIVDNTVNDGTDGASLASCGNSKALTTTDTITITWSSATSASCQVWLQEVTSSPYGVADRTTSDSKTSQATTAVTGGTLPTLSTANQIIFGVFKWNNGAIGTAGAGYTAVTTGTLNNAAFMEYQIVSATTGIAVNCTSSVNQGRWAGVGVAYRETRVPASTRTLASTRTKGSTRTLANTRTVAK